MKIKAMEISVSDLVRRSRFREITRVPVALLIFILLLRAFAHPAMAANRMLDARMRPANTMVDGAGQPGIGYFAALAA